MHRDCRSGFQRSDATTGRSRRSTLASDRRCVGCCWVSSSPVLSHLLPVPNDARNPVHHGRSRCSSGSRGLGREQDAVVPQWHGEHGARLRYVRPTVHERVPRHWRHSSRLRRIQPTAERLHGPRLADDIIAVIDQLRLDRPILVGHSIAGEELSYIGAHAADRIGGLIYFDAAYDRADPTYSAVLKSWPGQPPDHRRSRHPARPIKPSSSEPIDSTIRTRNWINTRSSEMTRFPRRSWRACCIQNTGRSRPRRWRSTRCLNRWAICSQHIRRSTPVCVQLRISSGPDTLLPPKTNIAASCAR